MAIPDPRTVVVELALPQAGIAAVDALARLMLEARRLGIAVRVVRAPLELRELIVIAGLDAALGVEPRGQPEQREQPLRVEEERQLGHEPV